MDNVEGKYLQGDIDRQTFRKWQTSYYQEKSVLENEISYVRQPLERQWEQYNGMLSRLGDLKFIYTKATTEQKQGMIGWVFDNQLYYEGGIYRTPFIQPHFASKAASLNEKRLLVYEQPLQKTPEIASCTLDGAN